MKLFLISQQTNEDWEAFACAVVCAPDEATARNMNPASGKPMTEKTWRETPATWCSSPDEVKVECLGEARDGLPVGVINNSNQPPYSWT